MRTPSSGSGTLLSPWGLSESLQERLRGGMLNENCRVWTKAGQFVLKMYRYRDARQVAFEQKMLRCLADRRFPCPRVVATQDGRTLLEREGKVMALYTYLPGKTGQAFELRDLRRVGFLLGRLHRVLRREKQTVTKDRWEPRDVARLLRTESRQILQKRFPGARTHLPYLAQEYTRLRFPKTLPTGITHQDIKPDNIVFDGRRISFIDFDNMYRGVLLFDAMTPVIWMCFRGSVFSPEAFRAYCRGYESARPFTQLEKTYLHDALRFRLLRESFAWAMRFNTARAHRVHAQMFRRYLAVRDICDI